MSPDPGAIRAIVEQAEEMRVEPPRPLTRQMPPADAFPIDALGDVLGAAARAIHDRVQAPLAICSQSVLAAAALAVQAHADVELPMGHVRPVSDFFVTVAETGARKSASDTEATWPIRKREQALCETRDAELPNYVNDKTDTLQSEPRIPTPPKPPNAPKANLSEPVSLPILGGLGTLGAPTLKNETSPPAATPPPLSFSARTICNDFKDDGAANGEHGSDMPLAGTAIIAPGKWVERIAVPVSSEPGFSEPWPPRRGRIELQGNTLLHFCSVCGAWGSYGFGVNLRNGRMGRWFCAAHRAQGRTAR